jgi:hypothetical protein
MCRDLLVFSIDRGGKLFKNVSDVISCLKPGAITAVRRLLEKRRPPVASPPHLHAVDEDLRLVFDHYASWGNRLSTGPTAVMGPSGFQRFVREMGIVSEDEWGLRLGDADLVYKAATSSMTHAKDQWKASGYAMWRLNRSMVQRKMTFDDFIRSLVLLANKRFPTLAALHDDSKWPPSLQRLLVGCERRICEV